MHTIKTHFVHNCQLEEQLGVFVQVQSRSQDVQARMEIAWSRERDDQKRLLDEAHRLAVDLQVSGASCLVGFNGWECEA